MLIVSIDNNVEKKYLSLPMTLILMHADGKIINIGGESPMDFDEKKWELEIQKHVVDIK